MGEWIAKAWLGWRVWPRRWRIVSVCGSVIGTVGLIVGLYLVWDVIAAILGLVGLAALAGVVWGTRPVLEQYVAHELTRRRSIAAAREMKVQEDRDLLGRSIEQIELVDGRGRELLNRYRYQPDGVVLISRVVNEYAGDYSYLESLDADRGDVRGAIDALAGTTARIRDDGLRADLERLAVAMEAMYLSAYSRRRDVARQQISATVEEYRSQRDTVRSRLGDRWRELE